MYLAARCERCGEPLAATPWRNGKHSNWSHVATQLYQCGTAGAMQPELELNGRDQLAGIDNTADLYGSLEGPELEELEELAADSHRAWLEELERP